MAIFISRLWTQPILITAMLASLVNITGCAKKAEQQGFFLVHLLL